MIRLHTIRDANLGHLAEKSGITPRGKLWRSQRNIACVFHRFFSIFHPLRWMHPKKSLAVARSELETKGLLVQHVLATMRWSITLTGRTALHVECYSWHLHFPLAIICSFCEDVYLDPGSQGRSIRQWDTCIKTFWKSKTKR